MIARATASRSSVARSWVTTCAPLRRVRASFTAGASAGMTMVAAMPRSRAASATPCAWLPEETAITPFARSASESDDSAL